MPQQALFFLNSPFMVARGPGAWPPGSRGEQTDDAGRIERAYQSALRPPAQRPTNALGLEFLADRDAGRRRTS